MLFNIYRSADGVDAADNRKQVLKVLEYKQCDGELLWQYRDSGKLQRDGGQDCQSLWVVDAIFYWHGDRLDRDNPWNIVCCSHFIPHPLLLLKITDSCNFQRVTGAPWGWCITGPGLAAFLPLQNISRIRAAQAAPGWQGMSRILMYRSQPGRITELGVLTNYWRSITRTAFKHWALFLCLITSWWFFKGKPELDYVI